MTYREALRHLNARQQFGLKFGLDNITGLLRRLGNPERSFTSVHVAGTNGKGSTAAMLASIFTAQGLTAGLYTSPHISTVHERFRVNGEPIKNDEFAALYEQILPHLEEIPCTYFECTTALAFLYFRYRHVDTAVVEVGLGGRFDATNVVKPACSIITSIGYDHREHLGETLEEIVREKCGIIKEGVPVVSGVTQKTCRRIVTSIATQKHAPLFEAANVVKFSNEHYSTSGISFTARIDGVLVPEIFLPLLGTFQAFNAQTALSAYSVVQNGTTETHIPYIRKGLASVVWQDRFMLYRRNPDLIIDVAHNEMGFLALSENIRKLFPGKKVLLVVGMKADKDCERALKPVLPLCRAGIGIPVPLFSRGGSGGEGASRKKLQSVFQQEHVPFKYFHSVRSGVMCACAMAGKNDVILCAGSHFTVHAIKKAINLLD